MGPIEGLTTGWHPIAFLNEDPPQPHDIFVDVDPGKNEAELVVPLGVDLLFRCGVPSGGIVEWEGASEVDRVGALSTAFCRLDSPQATVVKARLRTPGGEGEVSVRLRAIDVDLDRIRVERPRITVDRLDASDVADNASSVEVFLGSSIADLGSDRSGSLVTSVDRFVDLEAIVEPAELAPLVEWTIDGAPRLLAAKARVRLLQPGQHEIRVGSGVGAKTVAVTTYSVRIVREQAPSFAEDTPLTFRAQTTPAGYEDRVRWLASTRSGSATPALGVGEVFTTVFSNTADAAGRWAGVKADHAKADFDANPVAGPEGGLEIESSSAAFKNAPYNYRVRAWYRAGNGNELIHDIGVDKTAVVPAGPFWAGLTGCRTFAEQIVFDNGNYPAPQSYTALFDFTGCNGGPMANIPASGLASVKMSVDNDPHPDTQVILWSGPNLGAVTWEVTGDAVKIAETAATVTIQAIAAGQTTVTGTAVQAGRHCKLITRIDITN